MKIYIQMQQDTTYFRTQRLASQPRCLLLCQLSLRHGTLRKTSDVAPETTWSCRCASEC